MLKMFATGSELAASAAAKTVYTKLYELLRVSSADALAREVEHEAVGVTVDVTKIRGNALHQAAKAMVVVDKKTKNAEGNYTNYYLIIVAGDKGVDKKALKGLLGIKDAAFLDGKQIPDVTGCEVGAVPPYSFNPALQVYVDDDFLAKNEKEGTPIVFNAGSLSRSFYVEVENYLATSGAKRVKGLSTEPPAPKVAAEADISSLRLN